MPRDSSAGPGIDVVAGIVVAGLMVARMTSGMMGGDALAIHLHSLARAALAPTLFLLSRHRYHRHRAALALATRAALALSLCIPYEAAMPAATSRAPCVTNPATFLIYTSALPSFFVNSGYPVPLGTHFVLAFLQHVAALPKTLSRCVAPAPASPAPGSFLAHFPASLFSTMQDLLDW